MRFLTILFLLLAIPAHAVEDGLGTDMQKRMFGI